MIDFENLKHKRRDCQQHRLFVHQSLRCPWTSPRARKSYGLKLSTALNPGLQSVYIKETLQRRGPYYQDFEGSGPSLIA